MMNATSHVKLEYTNLAHGGRVARLQLNRPDQANAFSGEMMTEIAAHLSGLSGLSDVRVLVISGLGKHFSAGADLNWMKSSAALSFEENLKDAAQLKDMFESIVNLPIPKIAVVQGAVYGGAVGIVACCDYAIADTGAKFCLSEAKLGLVPAVIGPYLLRKIRQGSLKRLALTAQVFMAPEAKEAGLVEIVTDNTDEALKNELNALLACGPNAQIAINKLFESLRKNAFAQGKETIEAIAKARTSAEGQTGLSSFFAKSPPPWVRSLD
jgi:methylglutaconyl-CoA hydratase